MDILEGAKDFYCFGKTIGPLCDIIEKPTLKIKFAIRKILHECKALDKLPFSDSKKVLLSLVVMWQVLKTDIPDFVKTQLLKVKEQKNWRLMMIRLMDVKFTNVFGVTPSPELIPALQFLTNLLVLGIKKEEKGRRSGKEEKKEIERTGSEVIFSILSKRKQVNVDYKVCTLCDLLNEKFDAIDNLYGSMALYYLTHLSQSCSVKYPKMIPDEVKINKGSNIYRDFGWPPFLSDVDDLKFVTFKEKKSGLLLELEKSIYEKIFY